MFDKDIIGKNCFRENISMNRYLFITAFTAFIFLLAGCGKGLMESGDEAFGQQNYSEALKYYLEVVKEGKNDPGLNEKIVLCYFREGELIYEKRRVIKAFEARIKSGLLYLPENPSPEILQTVSHTYLKLAYAYKNTRAENPFQQRKYFDRALENIEKALDYDSTNAEAKQTLHQFREENFTQFLQKGITAYNKGRSDGYQYFAAEHYLSNARKLDPANREVNRYLTLTRTKTLALLDPGLEVPMAIADQMKNHEYQAYLVVVENLLPENLYVSPGHFCAVREDGREFWGKTSGMFMTPLENKSLTNGQETSGVVVFPLPDKSQYARLEFRKDGEVLGYKNLP